MDPIPAWVRRLWDIWDLRMLVLLSFTLQIILSIFGSRRKYISSVWISILVWSAYIMADWVATVALGKLSDAQGNQEKINELWVIWAPLLLLHLGGPDAITAYSLVDNKLWLRHFVGLVVQLSTIMDWLDGSVTYQWISMPVHDDSIVLDAMEVSMGLMYDLLYTKAAAIYTKGGFIMRCISFGCTVSVLIGLAIQTVLLKTKEGEGNSDIDEEENWPEIDTLITWVLIVGAVALEIYAHILIFSSNWMMLWLISQGKKERVTWLSQRFSSLFKTKKDNKKNWCNKVGQFDILGYLLKERDDVQSPVRKIIRSVLGPTNERKWNRYRYNYKTADVVHPPVYNAILPLCRYFLRPGILTDSTSREVNKIWAGVTHVERSVAHVNPQETDQDRSVLITEKENYVSLSAAVILDVHLVTEIFYHGIGEEYDPSGSSDASWSWKEDREVSKTMSDYMMYLLVMHPSLLPNAGSRRSLELKLQDLREAFKDPEMFASDEDGVKAACHWLLSSDVNDRDDWMQRSDESDERKRIRGAVETLKGMEKKERWEIIKLMWWKMLFLATYDHHGFGQRDSHFQRLREGGELLTLIWFFNLFF